MPDHQYGCWKPFDHVWKTTDRYLGATPPQIVQRCARCGETRRLYLQPDPRPVMTEHDYDEIAYQE